MSQEDITKMNFNVTVSCDDITTASVIVRKNTAEHPKSNETNIS